MRFSQTRYRRVSGQDFLLDRNARRHVLGSGVLAAGVLSVLVGAAPARADVQVSAVRLNGQAGILNAAPGSTVSLDVALSVTNTEACPGCPAQVVLALDGNPLQCLFDDIPGPDPVKRTATFGLPSDPEGGVHTLYAVFEEESTCAAAVERYRQNGANDPARPRTPIGLIVTARGTVEIELTTRVYETGQQVEGQVVGIPRIAANVTVELKVFDDTGPQDPSAIVASFTSPGIARNVGQPVTLSFAFPAPANAGIFRFYAALKASDAVLGTAVDRIGVRGPELKAAPPEILAGQVATLPVTDLITKLDTSSAGGTHVEIQLGDHLRRVKVQEQLRIFANPSVIPEELRITRHYIGVTTDAAGTAIPGSLVVLTADLVGNRIAGSIRDIVDPGAPVPSQESLWVESMDQYDTTLDPQAGVHLIYRLSDTLPPHEHGETPSDVPANIRPGDVNRDGDLDLSDAVKLLGYLFLGDTLESCYLAEGLKTPNAGGLAIIDWNGDGGYDLSDAIGLLTYLFTGGQPHALGAACLPIEGLACASTCTPGGAHAERGRRAGGGDIAVDIPVYLYLHPTMNKWRSYNIYLNWRATLLSELRDIPRLNFPYDKVTVSDLVAIDWVSLSDDGYFGLDCDHILKKFKDENKTSQESLHILFTVHGLLSCSGNGYRTNSVSNLYAMVVHTGSSIGYQSVVLAQETGHNLDYHQDPLNAHEPHLDPAISEGWWKDHGWWIFSPIWYKHCTAMMASYGGCEYPHISYHNSSIEPLRHLAEGVYQFFQ